MFNKEKEVIFLTLAESLRKSKIIITQYVSIGAGFLQTFGDQITDAFYSNSAQLQSMIDSKVFAIISISCAILTIYLKFTSKSLVGKEKVKEEQSNG